MEDRQEKQDAQRIILIKEAVLNAEKNLQTAKSLLAQIESKYTLQKKSYGVAEGGKIVEGTFDGQLMIGVDGRQYPVPANYASKSKLVEGDMLKLVITDDGSFIYKQIGPFKRKRLIGILEENSEEGGYAIDVEEKTYKVLLAAVTYHHAEPGDEIAIVVADTDEARWAAIENVTKKGERDIKSSKLKAQSSKLASGLAEGAEARNPEPTNSQPSTDQTDGDVMEIEEKENEKKSKKEKKAKEESNDEENSTDIDEELTPDLEEIERELKKQVVRE